jgi:hypothetical protein
MAFSINRPIFSYCGRKGGVFFWHDPNTGVIRNRSTEKIRWEEFTTAACF